VQALEGKWQYDPAPFAAKPTTDLLCSAEWHVLTAWYSITFHLGKGKVVLMLN